MSMASYGVQYLTRLQKALKEFSEAFDEWMQTQDEVDHFQARGLFPTVSTKRGEDPQVVRALELRVAEAAGAAVQVASVTGVGIYVSGVGPVDPIANWSMMSNPKTFLSPREVRNAVANARGRLQALIADAEARGSSDLPAFSPAGMHQVVWNGAAQAWTAHQYRVSVREGMTALTSFWRDRLDRRDGQDNAFWQQSLSAGEPQPGKPKLRWPGDVEDQTAKSMRGGMQPLATSLNNLATGVNLTIRNPATHSTGEYTEQEAMEQLAAVSFLGRLLDQCAIDHAPTDTGTATT